MAFGTISFKFDMCLIQNVFRSYYWLSILLPSVTLLLVLRFRSRRGYSKLPPGPKGIPILGNVFQVPSSMPWFRYTELSKEHGTYLSYYSRFGDLDLKGPIFTLNMAGQVVIVLNSHKIAADLFGTTR